MSESIAGACLHTKTITRQALERRVLGALRNGMLSPELVEEFIAGLDEASSASRKDILGRQLGLQRELTDVTRKMEGVMQSVERGAWRTPKVGERLKALEARELEINDLLREMQAPAPPPALSARGAEIYMEHVADLEAALNDPANRDEAGDALRGLIEKIVLTPDPTAEGGLSAMLHRELASILNLAAEPGHNRKLPGTGVPGSQLSVVAGTRFELMTFRL